MSEKKKKLSLLLLNEIPGYIHINTSYNAKPKFNYLKHGLKC